ncbi:lysoplasmalogenase [Salinibacterium hongtaonis]|nr:lysoplasmalogenase [Salinibacterium hongtaonis]
MLLTRPSGRAILAFAPYGLVSLVHLSALILGASEVGVVTKIMLMPALALALLILLPARRSVVGYLLLSALVLSWGGDFALVIPGELMFLLGLIFFLAAHVVYIVAISSSLRVRRIPFVALAYAGWWIALVALLAPNVGWLVWPLAIYGLVLGGMASVALGSHPAVACGAFLFVVSDTVLALNRFMPSIELPVPDIVIMATYILAQGFIVAGALIVLKRGVPSAWGSPRKERVLNS